MAKKASNQNKSDQKSQHHKVSPIELQKCLSGVDYPADRGALIEMAEDNGASEDVLDILERMPEQTFEGPAEVMKAFGAVNQSPKDDASEEGKSKAG